MLLLHEVNNWDVRPLDGEVLSCRRAIVNNTFDIALHNHLTKATKTT